MKAKHIKTLFVFLLLVIAVQFASAEQLNLVHDANGNTISGDGFYREYNEFNQLVRIRNGTASSPILEEYVYHPTEERVLIKDTFRNGAVFETVYYINDEFVRVVNSSGTYDTVYVHMDGQLVAQKNADGTKNFIHSDHLGSASVITDESGNAIENTSYSPDGEILTGGTKSRFSFTGQEYESAIDEYDFDARHYKQKWRQFITADPLFSSIASHGDTPIRLYFNPQKLNKYSYALNNPYKYVDPYGLDTTQYGFGVNVQPAPNFGGGISFGLAYDDKGNLGVYISVTGTASVGLGASADIFERTTSENEDISALSGESDVEGWRFVPIIGVGKTVSRSPGVKDSTTITPAVGLDATYIIGGTSNTWIIPLHRSKATTKTNNEKSNKDLSNNKGKQNQQSAQINKVREEIKAGKYGKNTPAIEKLINVNAGN